MWFAMTPPAQTQTAVTCLEMVVCSVQLQATPGLPGHQTLCKFFIWDWSRVKLWNKSDYTWWRDAYQSIYVLVIACCNCCKPGFLTHSSHIQNNLYMGTFTHGISAFIMPQWNSLKLKIYKVNPCHPCSYHSGLWH